MRGDRRNRGWMCVQEPEAGHGREGEGHWERTEMDREAG